MLKRFRPLAPALEFGDDMELALHEPLLIVVAWIPEVHQAVADLHLLLPDPFDESARLALVSEQPLIVLGV